MKNKKLILIISIVVGIILLSVGGFLLYKYIEIKNAVVKVVLKDNLEADFVDTLKVSSFIESINGKIVNDYYLNTDSLGKKKIDFEYINDDGIKIKYNYEINVVDREAPLIWLGKSYNVTRGSEDNLIDKIMCGDNYDNNPECVIEGDYNLDNVGSYNLVFKATDSSGNVSKKKFILNVNEASSKKESNGVKSVTEFSDVIKNYKNDNTQIGIDVSKWQGDIDFSKLKSAGVEFVIIRIGSSTGINGENFIDSKFIQNIKNANSVGIPVGVYFYSYANSVDRAISDAKWIIENIKDYKVELPIAFDWENWGSFNTYELSFFGLTNMAKRFMDTVKDAGYDAMLYSSKTYLENIWMSVDYPVWLAHYTKNTNYAGDYSYWQICSNGRVDGINGDVDIDIRYID
ncbi:MAG: glycoside hydrolase family 25 protein [Firmicutes bacterium]|uniref:glycoside hydrolase family 25 protein n=1 Tax=Candidatus Onthocola sp. TaxID=3085646 RepID=UPI002423A938|nr:glycoside hydrolase family 25 protein [Bacillota bacterium]